MINNLRSRINSFRKSMIDFNASIVHLDNLDKYWAFIHSPHFEVRERLYVDVRRFLRESDCDDKIKKRVMSYYTRSCVQGYERL